MKSLNDPEPDFQEINSDVSVGLLEFPEVESIEELEEESISVEKENKKRSFQLPESILKAQEDTIHNLIGFGEVLPETHHVYQYMAGIFDKLEKPDGAKLVIVDSEEFIAFYSIKSRQIFLGRGFLREITENDIASEDLIASVIGHELGHASSPKMKEPNDSFSKHARRWNRFDHAEEMRADREGVLAASRAGYNPLAFLEFFRASSLTHGRFAPNHPENIERVRKIEILTGDDETPIPNCGNSYTPVPEEIKKWAITPSAIYDIMDEVLTLTHDELDDRLSQAPSLGEFFSLLELSKHTQLVGEAKSIQQMPEMKTLYQKLILLRALKKMDSEAEERLDVFEVEPPKDPETKLSDDARRAFSDKEHLAGEGYKERTFFAWKSHEFNGLLKPGAAGLSAESFRREVDPKGMTPAVIDGIRADTNGIIGCLDKEIRAILDKANNVTLPRRERAFVSLISKAFSSGELPSIITKEIFSHLDQKTVQKKKKKLDQKADARGERASGEMREDRLYDLHRREDLERIMEADILQQAFLLSDYHGPSKKVSQHFTDLLQRELECDRNGAKMIYDFFFGNNPGIKNEEAWKNYLTTLDKDTLLKRIRDMIERVHGQYSENNSGSENEEKMLVKLMKNLPKLERAIDGVYAKSPLRPAQSGLTRTVLGYRLKHVVDNSPSITYDPHPSNKRRELRQLAGRELYKRGYTGNEAWKEGDKWSTDYKSTRDIELSDEEWELLSEVGINKMKSSAEIKALRSYLQTNGDLSKLSSSDQDCINSINSPLNIGDDLSIQELSQLLDQSPWPKRKTLYILRDILGGNHYDAPLILKSNWSEELEALYLKYYRLRLSSELKSGDETSEKETEEDQFWEAPENSINYLIAKKHEFELDKPGNILSVLSSLIGKSVEFSFVQLTSDIKYAIRHLSPEALENLADAYESKFGATETSVPSSTEVFRVYSKIPLDRRSGNKGIEFLESRVSPQYISYLFEFHKDSIQEIIDDITVSFSPSYFRDAHIIAVWEQLPEDLRIKDIDLFHQQLTAHPEYPRRRKSPVFDARRFVTKRKEINERYKKSAERLFNRGREQGDPEFSQLSNKEQNDIQERYKEDQRKIHLDPFRSMGIMSEDYEDLLLRRHNFQRLCFSFESQRSIHYDLDKLEKRGTPQQRFLATRLLHHEEEIFSEQSSPEDQVHALTGIAPKKTVVRDQYLDVIFRKALEENHLPKRIIELSSLIIPLFTEDSPLKIPYATKALRAEVVHNPLFLSVYDTAIGLIRSYLPKASLARNHFLGLLELNAPLTPEQIREIKSFRLTQEGEQEGGNESSPFGIIFSRIGELNRTEKITTLLWLLKIDTSKPQWVNKSEEELEGHMNNFPSAFLILTPPEQTLVIQRLCLGAEGILDLEAVEKGKVNSAEAAKQGFLGILTKSLIPGNKKESKFLRKICIHLLEKADPSRSTQILARIIAVLGEKSEGSSLASAQIAGILLEECGVIGKKVAQSLAGLSWIKNNFPEYAQRLAETQSSETTVVPKRALLIYAEAEGLIDGSKGIRIIELGPLLGAASNKQACLLTVEITDSRYGLPLGRQQLVGKFKRPSAQKTHNLNHDLQLAESILTSVSAETSGKIPRGFLESISYPLMQELDFSNEVKFSEALKVDIASSKVERHYEMSTSDIIYVGDDMVLETLASGISYRDFLDGKGNSDLCESMDENKIAMDIVTQSLQEILLHGRFNADLHPGNIFVSHGTLTIIDKGMNGELDQSQRYATLKLFVHMMLGYKKGVLNALDDLGYSGKGLSISLKKFNLLNNVNSILKALQDQKSADPALLLIIVSLSKLAQYTENLSLKDKTRLINNIGLRSGLLPTMMVDKVRTNLSSILKRIRKK